jgi:viologen exporter family transport system permease protein
MSGVLAALPVYLRLAAMVPKTVIWLVNPQLAWDVQQRVREGQIAVDLARPVPFPGQMVAQHVGGTIGVLPLVAVALPVALVAGSLRPPPSVESAALYLVSLVLAYAVMALMGLLLGFVAFWTLETTGMLAIFRFANLFFAGGLVPLVFFPPPLRAVAEVLPFQTQAFIPVSLYLGRLEGPEALRALGIQLLWVVLLGVIAAAVWRRAVTKIVVQGG